MILRIHNTPRPYKWGSRIDIAELLGTAPSGEPEAELWLGGHPGSPARIVEGASESDLAEWAAAHRSDKRLPFLMKVLAAAAPLSLQAHPTLDQARDGFERENSAGIPLTAPTRNYKDPWNKPELLYSLSDTFRALTGFRQVSEARGELASVGDARLAPFVERLDDTFGLQSATKWLLESGHGVDGVVAALTEYARSPQRASPTWETVLWLSKHYPGDPGVAVSTLMHTVVLGHGEAIYLPAGNLHAYLDGVGLEVMVASDNVLRGGLTSKHVDVLELMRVVDFRPLPTPRLAPHQRQEGVRFFRPDEGDFTLTMVDSSALEMGVALPSAGAAIVLCLNGDLTIRGDGADSIHVKRGEAVFSDEATLIISGNGTAAVASGA